MIEDQTDLLIELVPQNCKHGNTCLIIWDDCLLDKASTCKLVKIITGINSFIKLVKNTCSCLDATLGLHIG
jgi:hypothetical protein